MGTRGDQTLSHLTTQIVPLRVKILAQPTKRRRSIFRARWSNNPKACLQHLNSKKHYLTDTKMKSSTNYRPKLKRQIKKKQGEAKLLSLLNNRTPMAQSQRLTPLICSEVNLRSLPKSRNIKQYSKQKC